MTKQAVYWLQRTDGAIKGGWTGRGLLKRRADHEAEYENAVNTGRRGNHFRLIAATCGNEDNERRIHKFFSALRVNGQTELFRPEEPLVGYLRWLRKQPFTACGHADNLVEDGVVFENSIFPAPQRTAPAPSTDEQYSLFPDPFEEFWGPSINTADDFYTPSEDIERVREFLGSIDLDPASHRVANSVVKARNFYSKAENGLRLEWPGRVWVNPPFSEWKAFGDKLVAEYTASRTSEAIALAHVTYLTNGYMRPVLDAATAICLRTGRMRFWGKHVDEAEEKGTDNPRHGQVLIYLGQRAKEFKLQFGGEYGSVWLVS